MGEFGPASVLIHRLIGHTEMLTPEEAADLFRARAIRQLNRNPAEERRALLDATRAARVSNRWSEYQAARHQATAAWMRARHGRPGPWLSIGVAVANAAGALVVEDLLSAESFDTLFGPWQQAIGRLIPVGPGATFSERVQAHEHHAVGRRIG